MRLYEDNPRTENDVPAFTQTKVMTSNSRAIRSRTVDCVGLRAKGSELTSVAAMSATGGQ